MQTLRPVKPEQHNGFDCGIYLLHYVEKIFGSVAQFYWPSALNDLDGSWFPLEEVAKKRDELAKLIRDLSTEQRKQAGQAEVAWPNISFVDRAPPPRKAKAKTDAIGEEAEEKVLETVPDSFTSVYGAQAATSSEGGAGRRDPPRLDIRGPKEEAVAADEAALEPEVVKTADSGVTEAVAMAKPKRRLRTPLERSRDIYAEIRNKKSRS